MKNFILSNASWVKTWLTEKYPIPHSFIRRHEKNIDWKLLSRNEKIEYTLEFCERYRNKLNWDEFNPVLSPEFRGKGRDERLIAFLDHFKHNLNWDIITQSLRTPENTERLIESFESYWDWGNLCLVETIPWNLELMRKFKDKIVWHCISVNNRVPWKYEWIEEFADLLDWHWFPVYSSYTWDFRSVQRFRRNMEKAGVNVKSLSFKTWLSESGIGTEMGEIDDPGNEDTVDPISEEEFELNDDVATMAEVIDELSESLNSNKELTHIPFIQLNLQSFSYLMSFDNVNRLELASEAVLAEPHEILRKFRDVLDWGGYYTVKSTDENGKEIDVIEPKGICSNCWILWTEAMMDEFVERIHWEILGKCGRMKWTTGMVEKHFHKFDKNDLLKKDALFHKLIIPAMNENMWELVFGLRMG